MPSGGLSAEFKPPYASSVSRPANGWAAVAPAETAVVATADHAPVSPDAECALARNSYVWPANASAVAFAEPATAGPAVTPNQPWLIVSSYTCTSKRATLQLPAPRPNVNSVELCVAGRLSVTAHEK